MAGQGVQLGYYRKKRGEEADKLTKTLKEYGNIPEYETDYEAPTQEDLSTIQSGYQEAEKSSEAGRGWGSALGAVAGGILGGVLGTVAMPALGTAAGAGLGMAAGGGLGAMVGEGIGGTLGEQHLRQAQAAEARLESESLKEQERRNKYNEEQARKDREDAKKQQVLSMFLARLGR